MESVSSHSAPQAIEMALTELVKMGGGLSSNLPERRGSGSSGTFAVPRTPSGTSYPLLLGTHLTGAQERNSLSTSHLGLTPWTHHVTGDLSCCDDARQFCMPTL